MDIFKFALETGLTFDIRVVDLDGNPWFVAKDACQACGILNTTRALSALAPDEKGLQRVKTPGGEQTLNVISESGLYKLVMRSDKPQARRFQDWVTREVLPAIRKDGAYVMGEEVRTRGGVDCTGRAPFVARQSGCELRDNQDERRWSQRFDDCRGAALRQASSAAGRQSG